MYKWPGPLRIASKALPTCYIHLKSSNQAQNTGRKFFNPLKEKVYLRPSSAVLASSLNINARRSESMFRLLPKEDKYFDMFNSMATQMTECALLLQKLFSDFDNRVAYADKIKEVEHNCNLLTHEIVKKLKDRKSVE